MIQLRNHQNAAINALFEAMRFNQRTLLAMPTGAGKRYLAVWLCERAVAKGRRVLFVNNRRLVVGQMFDHATAEGIPLGIIMANSDGWDMTAPIQIASVQTLESRYYGKGAGATAGEGLPPADLVIIDECHLDIDRYCELLSYYPDAKVVGLTATPVGPQGKSMVPTYDVMIEGAKNTELIAAGLLLPTKVYAPSEPDIQGVKIVNREEYSQAGLSRRIQEVTCFADVWQEWQCHADRKTVCFAPGVAFARGLCEQFRHRLGSEAAYVITADTKPEERKAAFEAMESGHGKVLVSVDVLREGWDCLDTETKVLTPDGWRSHDQIQVGDPIYSLRTRTGLLVVDKVRAVAIREVRPGEGMVTLESQHMNIRVTTGHRFCVKYSDPNTKTRSVNWLSLSGNEIAKRRSEFHLPISAMPMFKHPGVPLTDDEIRFVAWFMTDGGFCKSAVCITQCKPKYVAEIRNLLDRLGVDYRYRVRVMTSGYKTNNPAHEFSVPKGTYGGSMARSGWKKYEKYLSKNVSSALDQMTRDQFILFWEELLKGDGERCEGKAGWLWCDRIEQAERYTQMAIERGLSSSYSERVTKNYKTVYRVSVRDKQWICSRPSDPRSTKISVDVPAKDERVWCVQTSEGTIVTKRGGKIAILGNCSIVSCGIDLQPNAQMRTYWQKIGRVKRAHEGQTHAVWIDMAGNYWRHPHPDEDPDWSVQGEETTQERYERTPQEKKPALCPKCGAVRRGAVCAECGHESSGPPIRRIRMGNGKLREIRHVEKLKREKTELERKLDKWKSVLFMALKSGNLTFDGCRYVYQKKHGEWPDYNLPFVVEPGSTEGKRKVADALDVRGLMQTCGEFIRRKG